MAIGAWEQSSVMKTGNLSNSDIEDVWICRCSHGGSSSAYNTIHLATECGFKAVMFKSDSNNVICISEGLNPTLISYFGNLI
ncbi:hypothetical protein A2U01_0060585 [Trifolium medium]|uniref:Uncharacterized protein n=1 Tax=Trifolium medium TaxID=97028 RepID=A0A392RTG3_9FABA|nr:hypothetical protein [Trifolium medium]